MKKEMNDVRLIDSITIRYMSLVFFFLLSFNGELMKFIDKKKQWEDMKRNDDNNIEKKKKF